MLFQEISKFTLNKPIVQNNYLRIKKAGDDEIVTKCCFTHSWWLTPDKGCERSALMNNTIYRVCLTDWAIDSAALKILEKRFGFSHANFDRQISCAC